MLGYDWPRLHAAINDIPAAVLLVSVVFDVTGTLLKRESLKVAGFWTLMAGTAGAVAAVVAGLKAADVVEHSEDAHLLMSRHETFALITTAVFAILAVWRLVRRGQWRRKETPLVLTLSIIGLGLLIHTGQLGGALVFDHALGIPTARLEAVHHERESEGHEHGAAAHHHGDTDAAHMHSDSLPGKRP